MVFNIGKIIEKGKDIIVMIVERKH